MTSLWPDPVDTFTFQPVQSTIDCSPYYYKIGAKPELLPYLSILESSELAIQAKVTDLALVGQHSIGVKTCIKFGNGDDKCIISNIV